MPSLILPLVSLISVSDRARVHDVKIPNTKNEMYFMRFLLTSMFWLSALPIFCYYSNGDFVPHEFRRHHIELCKGAEGTTPKEPIKGPNGPDKVTYIQAQVFLR